MEVHAFPNRVITVNNKTYLYFGGTSYLGMGALAGFQDQVIKSIKQWGTCYGSSRNSNITLGIYNAFEQAFATYVGAEAVIAVSSGTLAGKSVLEYFTKRSVPCFHYPNSHPAILSPTSKPVFVGKRIHPDLTTSVNEDVVIVCDVIIARAVKPTDLHFLNDIPRNKRIHLVIDESHSLGILGKAGSGFFSTINTNRIYRKIMVSSLGKALALSGGVIASDSDFINSLRSEANYVSASPANPAYLEAFLKSKALYTKQQQVLKNNLKHLFSGQPIGGKYVYDSNYPVLYCNDKTVYNKLLALGIVISNFKYPNYNTNMNRIVISGAHTISDITQLKQAMSCV